ncbi:MAG: ATP synthase F1 subunit epsilon [Candidatus Levyibacteriota bacterium]
MADAHFHLEIVTPDGIIFKDDVDEIRVPTENGEITILPHHVPLYTRLAEGELHIKRGGKETLIAVMSGIVQVEKTFTNIISDYAVHADSIQVARAEEAKKRAEEIMKNQKNTAEFALADKDLRKSILELKVAKKIRHKSQ